MYKKVNASQNSVEREQEILKFWQENQVFEQSVAQSADLPSYTFYDGPPTANGMPHIGHVITRAVKDLFPRYHTMKGKGVLRKAGWDTHGLPVEIEIEKMLGISGKDQIENYGIAPFIDQCKESVWKYKGMWEDFSKAVGYWVDMEDPYVTYDNNYIESEWWALKEIFNKDLLYKGFKIVPYCPRCGTPLSSHEVAQGYKDVKERSAIVKFKLKNEDAYFLAWTTTPWTLPSNVALCVNPSEQYVKVQKEGETYIMAKALVATVLGEDVTIVDEFVGKTLEHTEYYPLWNFVEVNKKAWFVTCDNYVTLTDGTGIVHIAPAFGEDDAQVGRKYDLPFVQLVNEQGELTEETKWAGVFCKDADLEVLKDLEANGLLFSTFKFEHSYPHCWRCDTPLIYYARESWFIKMTAVKDDMIKNNNTINWMPKSIGTGRFGDWLENVQDWGISRNRYWGTPLNIWQCSCGHTHSIGSIEELKSMSKNCPENIELHRPYIDEVTITCSECGGEMTRVPEVIDCWFDSGAMPFAQHHYPFENQDLFKKQFPADFISEAVDQTRGWFYSLLAISTLLFNQAPYKNVIVLGHVQDKDGQKMSKSKGNAIDPLEALQQYGADAIRWYFYANSALWLPSRFHGQAVVEGQRKFLATLWNSYAFYVLYADIDGFDPTKYELDQCQLTVMDRWLLSKLNSVVDAMDQNLADFKVQETTKIMQGFVDELSNWYVRRNRERFWGETLSDDKVAAYMTLYTALVTFSKAAAPMIPFVTEAIYQNLVRNFDQSQPLSIHLCDFPTADQSKIDKTMEAHMETVLKVVGLGRAARNDAAIKNRQPLATLYLMGADIPELFMSIVREELNIKTVELIQDADQFVTYTFKPQLKILGQKYGKKVNEIRTTLLDLDGSAAKKQLDETGAIVLQLSDESISLTAEELLISTTKIEGYISATDSGLTIVLDTKLTPELVDEGMLREIVSKIQSMRKDGGFEVMDRVHISISTDDEIAKTIRDNVDAITSNVLAEDVTDQPIDGYTKEWNINGHNTVITLTRA